MAEIKRYMGPISSSLQPEADGEWVRYSDHKQALAQTRQSERQRVREVLESLECFGLRDDPEHHGYGPDKHEPTGTVQR